MIGGKLMAHDAGPRYPKSLHAKILVLGLFLLAGTVRGQKAPSKPDQKKVAAALAQVGQGGFTQGPTGILIEAHAVQAIPALEKQFPLAQGADAKGAIASALVNLGDKKIVYWKYLVDQASPGVNSDAPFPYAFDGAGKLISNSYSEQFLAWAKANNIPPDTAAQSAMTDYPSKLIPLAASGDPRGTPLLRRALNSSNYVLAGVAAKGLAHREDVASIPLIVEASKKAPQDAKSAIAISLLLFRDPQARKAAEAFFPADVIKAVPSTK